MLFLANKLLFWHVCCWGCLRLYRDDDETQQPQHKFTPTTTSRTTTGLIHMEEAVDETFLRGVPAPI